MSQSRYPKICSWRCHKVSFSINFSIFDKCFSNMYHFIVDIYENFLEFSSTDFSCFCSFQVVRFTVTIFRYVNKTSLVPFLFTKPIIKRNANLKIFIKGLILNLKHKPRATATFYVSKAELWKLFKIYLNHPGPIRVVQSKNPGIFPKGVWSLD